MATKKMTKGASAKKEKGSVGVKVGVAAGVAAALVGAYLMYAKSAEPQRKQAKEWIAKARKDVAREVGKLKNISASEYGRIIDTAMERYAGFKEANAPEIAKTAKDLKAEWKNIQAHAKKVGAMANGMKKPVAKKKAAKK